MKVLLAFMQYVTAIGKNDIRVLSLFDTEMFQTHLKEKYMKFSTQVKRFFIIDSYPKWCFEEKYLQ